VSFSKPPIKPVLLWLALGFLVFMIAVNPVKAADGVGSVLDFALRLLNGLGVFFATLAAG
jgi:hypothetical protein